MSSSAKALNVPHLTKCGPTTRFWLPLTGTSALTAIAAPTAGYRIVVLGLEGVASVDCSLTISGIDTTERSTGSGSAIIPCLGNLAWNLKGPESVGVFACTAATALQFTPSASSAGTGFILGQYVIERVA